MLVFVGWVKFDIVENLTELRLAEGKEIVGFERRGEELLREADEVDLVWCWGVG